MRAPGIDRTKTAFLVLAVLYKAAAVAVKFRTILK
jgi:hypothetical protein